MMEPSRPDALAALQKALGGDYTSLKLITHMENSIEAASELAKEGQQCAEVRAAAYQFLGSLKDPLTIRRIASGLYDFGDEAESEPMQVSRSYYYGEIVQAAAMHALANIGTKEALEALRKKLATYDQPSKIKGSYLCCNDVDKKTLEDVIKKLEQRVCPSKF